MDLGLRGKVAVVAAASQGLGKAVAAALAEEGAKVAICSRDRSRIEGAAAEIVEKTGGETLALRADVTRRSDIRDMVAQVVDAYGAIHVLVTNAGGPPSGEFSDVSEEDWYSVFDLTFMSAVRLIRECLPHMRKAGWGRIIAMTSLSVKQPLDNLVLSNAIRLAVVGMARSLSKDLAPHNINVNIVGPGFIGTERLGELFEARAQKEGTTAEDVEASLVSAIPIGRLGTPAELAQLVVFLASEKASYLTGNFIQVDGGYYRGVF